jgi:hypothetical protein
MLCLGFERSLRFAFVLREMILCSSKWPCNKMSRWRTRNATYLSRRARPTNRERCRSEELKTTKRRIKLHPAQKESLSRGSFSSSSGGIPSYQYGVLGTCKSSALFTCTARTARSAPRSRFHTSPHLTLKKRGTHKYTHSSRRSPTRH